MFSQEIIEKNISGNQNKNINSSIENNANNQEQIVTPSQQIVETETQLTFNTPVENQEISISSIGFLDILRVFLILAIVIVIAYGVILFLKRIQNKSLVNSYSIEILSTQSLQQGNMLYIIKTGSSYFLISTTSQSISLIKEFSKKEERDELLLSLSINAANSSKEVKSNFFSLLKGLFTNIKKNNEIQKKTSNNTDADNSVENALNSLRKNTKRGEKLNGT